MEEGLENVIDPFPSGLLSGPVSSPTFCTKGFLQVRPPPGRRPPRKKVPEGGGLSPDKVFLRHSGTYPFGEEDSEGVSNLASPSTGVHCRGSFRLRPEDGPGVLSGSG